VAHGERGENMTKVIVVGAKGRMGQALVRLATKEAGFDLVGAVDQGDDILQRIDYCDAIIEFSHHTVSGALAATAAQHGKALVIGTTGHTPEEKTQIESVQDKIPIVWAPNYSVGVNLLFYLTRKAAEILGEDFDQEVVEMHHRLKLDAPSGTAKRLGEILADVKGRPYAEVIRDGRVGEVGARTRSEIGMHALRGGDVVGDHTVHFANVGERLELTHRASSRDTFAAGALRAAAWAVSQKPGLYTMQDVLSLR
jgi:4-hydroxy-tetrahydrodipicolinate reductase